jgi:hypothetical protein
MVSITIPIFPRTTLEINKPFIAAFRQQFPLTPLINNPKMYMYSQ